MNMIILNNLSNLMDKGKKNFDDQRWLEIRELVDPKADGETQTCSKVYIVKYTICLHNLPP